MARRTAHRRHGGPGPTSIEQAHMVAANALFDAPIVMPWVRDMERNARKRRRRALRGTKPKPRRQSTVSVRCGRCSFEGNTDRCPHPGAR